MSIKCFLSAYRRSVIAVLFSALFLTALFFAVRNDSFLYRSTIARVTNVTNGYDRTETGPNGAAERYYAQEIALKILNGSDRGMTAKAVNTYSDSGINSERYEVGDDVFVTVLAEADARTATITGEKRDVYVALLAGLFLLGMALICRLRGVMTVLSFAVNLGMFVAAMLLYQKGMPFSRLRWMMILAFCASTLFLSGGISRKTIGAILSSFATLGLTALIYRVVTARIGEPPYELMDYIFVPEDLEQIFLAGVLIGCLGAVMDVAITVHSAVHELERVSGSLTTREIVKSIRAIGHDIMGTMINVLLFSYVCGSLPLIVIKIMNGFSLFSLVRYHIVFELIRFLVGSIGIVLAIPISGAVAVLLAKGGAWKCSSRS